MNDSNNPQFPETSSRLVYSPSELNQAVKVHLEAGFPVLWLQGEISNLARPASGHVYFSLKDERAQIRCALFRNKASLLQHPFANGDEVLVRGRISLYEPRGDYQLIADFMEPAGLGQLQQQFEALKQKLQKQGLFDESRKQPLPAMPQTIGVISSASGAAIQDFLQVLRRRWPLARILLYSSSVQGDKAATELRTALQRAIAHQQAEVLVLTRGGGSLEDLWSFNDEQLALAIAECPIPTVSAVGHEVDFTIADFVADVRAPTPSAAAEMISPAQDTVGQQLVSLQRTLHKRMRWQTDTLGQTLDYLQVRLKQQHPEQRLALQATQLQQLQQRLLRLTDQQLDTARQRLVQLYQRCVRQHPADKLQQHAQQLQQLQQRLQRAIQLVLNGARQMLQQQQRSLQAVGPEQILARGYALALDTDSDSSVLTLPDQFSSGQSIRLQFATFQIDSDVQAVRRDKPLQSPDNENP